jgi:branched-chain amino acid transport system permease protein
MTEDGPPREFDEILDWSPDPSGRLRAALGTLHPRRLPPRQRVGLLALGGLALVPGAVTPSQLIGVVFIVYLMIFAVSWDFVSGYTGQLSLGHAMFYATGGYTVTVLNLQHGQSPVVSFVLAVLAAGVLGLLVGFPALRLTGPYLSLITLVVPLIMLQSVTIFSTGLPLLAPDGLKGDAGFIEEPASLIGLGPEAAVTVDGFDTWIVAEYYLALLFLVVVLAFTIAVTRSHTGAVLEAIRERERVVGAVGLNPAKYKLFAFTTSGMIAGLAGAGFVLSPAGHTSPNQLLIIDLSLQVIVISVLGGMGTIVGAPVGVFIFGASNELLNSIPLTVPVVGRPVGHFEPVPAYLLALGILFYRPEGALPMLVEWGRRVQARVRGEPADARLDSAPLVGVLETYREYFDRDRE